MLDTIGYDMMLLILEFGVYFREVADFGIYFSLKSNSFINYNSLELTELKKIE